MSLSMVFGMPTTAFFKPRLSISFTIAAAPRSVPSPPMTNRISTFMSSSVSTMSPMSCWPRELPSIVPPKLCACSTELGRSTTGVCP